nr:ParB/RepB/Spo0J family partition protein [Brucella anthropi]
MNAINIDRYEACPETGVRFHEYANLFPMMDDDAFNALVEDIKINGVREPIVFIGNEILDGRNRYTAARQLGIEYPVTEYTGADPLGFVVSLNLKRRHLTESQRAMVASKLATLKHGQKKADTQICVSQPDAAAMLNVSQRAVQTAVAVQRSAVPELVKAVETGKVSVSGAALIAKQDEEIQKKIVAEDNLKKAVSELRQAEKQLKEVKAMPAPEPLTHEEKQRAAEIFGTQEDRAISAIIDEIIERTDGLPTPSEAARRIPQAIRYAVNPASIRKSAEWLITFAEIWEQESIAHEQEAAE